MSFTKSRYLAVASGHTDALIDYVLDVKPYHTKLSEIVERYDLDDFVNIRITDDHRVVAFLGADILNSVSAGPGIRARRSNSWWREVISDGDRNIFSLPFTSVHKFLSHARQERFVAGVHDDLQISGIENSGAKAFSQRRWEGPSITNVRRQGVHQQESFDYYLSHGAYSFETRGAGMWKELNIAHLTEFDNNQGVLLYHDVIKAYGTITDITGGDYDEWTLTCIDDVTQTLEVSGLRNGVIGTVDFGDTFTDPLISFNFGAAPDEVSSIISLNDTFKLTPFHKITVAPNAVEEVWSIIKTNPIVIDDKPEFVSGPSVDALSRIYTPALEIHTRSLDRNESESTWTVVFNGDGTYNLTKMGLDNPYTIENIDLRDGCSFKNDEIHFTLIPTIEGFYEGDTFSFTIGARVENFLVYGSVSGWQPNARLDEWYWNGQIGFKIPKLVYFAKTFNATISTSEVGIDQSWNVAVSNSQQLTAVSFNGAFYVAGANSIVGTSTNGTSWSSEVVPPGAGAAIVILSGSTIITSFDGATWTTQDSNTNEILRGSTYIPEMLSTPGGTPINVIIVVGDNGTILTSATGSAWAQRVSGTSNNLHSVAWSEDAIIAVGENGTILRSLDRVTWTPVTFDMNVLGTLSQNQVNFYDILYEPTQNVFVVVGDNGVIIKSNNGGLNWERPARAWAADEGTLSSVAYGNGVYVAVGPDGWVARSTDDGISWSRYAGRRFRSIAFGNGVFVTVGGDAESTELFTPLQPVHSIAEPSMYTITFKAPVFPETAVRHATVVNNLYGYRKALTVNEPWNDEFCSFQIDSIPGVYEYQAGDVIKVHIAPERIFAGLGWYDQHPYELPLYDTGVTDYIVPLLYNEEYYPMYHSHGTVIFVEDCVDGDNVVIDKALLDVIRLRIREAGSRYPELASVDDWVPLEFRYFDRPNSPSTLYDGRTAHFPDLTTHIEAYLCSDPNKKVFTISQPRYQCTNRVASATVTIDEDFFQQYLPFNTSYSFRVQPDSVYGEKIRIKITENLRVYAGVDMIYDETIFNTGVPSEEGPSELTTAAFVEGLGVQERLAHVHNEPTDELVWNITHDLNTTNVSIIAYDDLGNTVVPDSVTTPTPDTAVLTFASAVSGTAHVVADAIDRFSSFYDALTVPDEGLLIESVAEEYLITHNGAPGAPTLTVESVDAMGTFGSPIPSMTIYPSNPLITSPNSFVFSLPGGFTVPFWLRIT